MSNGIAHNNLNDISKIYLDTISDINKKEQEDDVKRWQQEEAGCDTTSKSPFRKKKVKAYKEAFSNWRKDLREVTSDAEAVEVDDQPEIKEKKVKNKIKINPEFKEAVKQMGGELLEVKEVDSPDGEVKDDKKAEADEAKKKKIADKERKLKMRILRVKMMATKQDAGASIVAGYEPDIEGAVEYFYEEGINEEGIDQLIEEIGLDEFVNFIEGGTVELNEERAARRASVRAKKYDVVKKEVDKADAARRKSKKGEYSSAYKKKETDVTVYDDKVSKKKTVKKTVKKTETVKKPVTKKVVKAVAKVKKTQPKKKATKQGLGDKIRSAYKAGVKRHRKATQVPRVFAKGAVSGAKKAVKFAKDVHKAVSEEELKERLGGKGYKSYTSLTGKKVSGDWEDSDRGAGNKAKKRAGGKVEKKSPTYLAHVHNKEGYEETKRGEVLSAFKRDPKVRKRFEKAAKKEGGPGSAKNRAADDMLQTAKNIAKRKGDTSKSDDRYAYEGYQMKEDKALAAVKAAIIKKHGKGAIYDPKKDKPPTEAQKKKNAAERKKRQDADNKAYAARAKKAGFKSTQDYTNVVARYGSEDNYRKGKGLGT